MDNSTMKFPALLTILALLLIYVPAQSQNDELDESDMREWTRGSSLVPTKAANEEIEGSPYFNSDWTRGRVILKSDKETDPMKLRYNVYSNQLEFQKSDKIMVALSKSIKGFSLRDKDNQHTTFRNGFKSREHDINENQFLRVIHDGKVKLAARHETKFIKARSVDPLTGEKISKFISRKDYYLITDDGRFHDIRLKRKHVLKALGNHGKKLRKFADENDLDFGDEKDLKKILDYYANISTSG